MKRILLILLVFVGCAPVTRIDPKASFLFFDKQEEASAWFQEHDIDVLSKSENRQPRNVVPGTDARYAPLNSMIETLQAAFAHRYPEKLKTLPTPFVVLVEDEKPNAFILPADGLSDETRVPYLLGITTSLLASVKQEDELYGVVAHELTHLFFLHGIPEIADGMRHVYRVDGTNETLGFLQKNDASLKDRVEHWIDLSRSVGAYPLAELDGLPFRRGNSKILYFELLEHYLSNLKRLDPPFGDDCIAAERAQSELSKILGEHYSSLSQEITLSETDKAALKKAAEGFKASSRKCWEGQKPDLTGAIFSAFGVKEDQAASLTNKEDIAKFDAQKNPIDAILTVVAPKQAEMRATAADLDLNHVRVYTAEEEADDVSAEILHDLKRNPLAQGDWLLRNGNLSETDIPKCKDFLNKGLVPPYGSLSDDHHSSCYRTFHIRRLADYLDHHS